MATEEEINQVLSKDLRALMAKGITNHVNAMTKALNAFEPKEKKFLKSRNKQRNKM